MESKLCLFELRLNCNMTIEQYTAILSRLRSGTMYAEFIQPRQIPDGMDWKTHLQNLKTVNLDRVGGVWERPEIIDGKLYATLRCMGPFGNSVHDLYEEGLVAAQFRTIVQKTHDDGRIKDVLDTFITWDIGYKHETASLNTPAEGLANGTVKLDNITSVHP